MSNFSTLKSKITKHNFCFFQDGVVDFLKATTSENQDGMSWVDGMCPKRTITSSDTALRLSQRALLTVNSAHAFPQGFPQDFSIIVTARVNKGNARLYMYQKKLSTKSKIKIKEYVCQVSSKSLENCGL